MNKQQSKQKVDDHDPFQRHNDMYERQDIDHDPLCDEGLFGHHMIKPYYDENAQSTKVENEPIVDISRPQYFMVKHGMIPSYTSYSLSNVTKSSQKRQDNFLSAVESVRTPVNARSDDKDMLQRYEINNDAYIM